MNAVPVGGGPRAFIPRNGPRPPTRFSSFDGRGCLATTSRQWHPPSSSWTGRFGSFGEGDKAKRDECVAGFGLSLSSWFTIGGEPRERLVGGILGRQLDDGGWNCRTRTPSAHSSFHTTINVLEGLREYCLSGGPQGPAVEAAEARAREFFCEHHLYRSHRSGRIPDERMTLLPFPSRWHHDVLRGHDCFRAAGAERDPRLEDPVEVLLGHRRKDGRWPIHPNYGARVWFNTETGRAPSRWNTLRALRVLRWWDSPK